MSEIPKKINGRLILGVILFIALRKLKWHPAIFIALSAVVGIIFKF